MVTLRITSPRWDAPTNRWQMPGEVVQVEEAEMAEYIHHAEIEKREPAPAPTFLNRMVKRVSKKASSSLETEV